MIYENTCRMSDEWSYFSLSSVIAEMIMIGESVGQWLLFSFSTMRSIVVNFGRKKSPPSNQIVHSLETDINQKRADGKRNCVCTKITVPRKFPKFSRSFRFS